MTVKNRDTSIYKGLNYNEGYRKSRILSKYPRIKDEDAKRITSLEELRKHGMQLEMEFARQLRRDLDFKTLLEWTEQYADEIEDVFVLTCWEKEFNLLKGVAYAYYKSERGKAKEYFDRAAGILVDTLDIYTQVTILKEYGNFYRMSQDYKLAAEYYLEARQMLCDNDLCCDNQYSEVLHNLGYAYIGLAKYDEADSVFNKALQSNQLNDLVDSIYLGKSHLASIHKDIAKCEFYLQEAWSANRRSGVKGIEPHLKVMEWVLKLHKGGIFEYEGKTLVLYDMEDNEKIYRYYMEQPEFKRKLMQYGIDYHTQKIAEWKQEMLDEQSGVKASVLLTK